MVQKVYERLLVFFENNSELFYKLTERESDYVQYVEKLEIHEEGKLRNERRWNLQIFYNSLVSNYFMLISKSLNFILGNWDKNLPHLGGEGARIILNNSDSFFISFGSKINPRTIEFILEVSRICADNFPIEVSVIYLERFQMDVYLGVNKGNVECCSSFYDIDFVLRCLKDCKSNENYVEFFPEVKNEFVEIGAYDIVYGAWEDYDIDYDYD